VQTSLLFSMIVCVFNSLAAHDVNSCLMLLEFLILFLNFDALTHLFLQPLACITEF